MGWGLEDRKRDKGFSESMNKEDYQALICVYGMAS